MGRNRALVLLTLGAIASSLVLTGSTLARGPDMGTDVTADASLRSRIVAAAAKFAKDGGEGNPNNLKAVRFADVGLNTRISSIGRTAQIARAWLPACQPEPSSATMREDFRAR